MGGQVKQFLRFLGTLLRMQEKFTYYLITFKASALSIQPIEIVCLLDHFTFAFLSPRNRFVMFNNTLNVGKTLINR